MQLSPPYGTIPTIRTYISISNSTIDGCRQGRRSDQHELYLKLKDQMFGLCLRYSRTREDAEDILHDGFIAVFKDIHQYKGEGPVEGWVRRVILNTALQFLRKQTKNIFIHRDDKDLVVVDESIDNDPFEKELLVQTMLKSIQDMPTGFRTVLNLYIIEGHSHEQIANVLGISIGTSKSQLFRAKEYLRKVLAKSFNVNE